MCPNLTVSCPLNARAAECCAQTRLSNGLAKLECAKVLQTPRQFQKKTQDSAPAPLQNPEQYLKALHVPIQALRTPCRPGQPMCTAVV
jgi:hypothetical protein